MFQSSWSAGWSQSMSNSASSVSSIPFSVLGRPCHQLSYQFNTYLNPFLVLGIALAWFYRPLPPWAPYHGNMGMHYCVMLELCAACHILDPRKQVSAVKSLGARPVTERDTFPEFRLGNAFPWKHFFISPHPVPHAYSFY